MPRSRITDDEVEKNAEGLYRHGRFLPDSVINLSPDQIREKFEKGLLTETDTGEIAEISIMTQALTENEARRSADIKKEFECYRWEEMTRQEKIEFDPIRYAEENELKSLEEQVRLENMGSFDLQAKIEEKNWYQEMLKETGKNVENQDEAAETITEVQIPIELEVERKDKEREAA